MSEALRLIIPSSEEIGLGDGNLYIPERSLKDAGMALLVFAAALFYLDQFYGFTTFHGDEGIVLQGAQRILQGQVLYRDFFSFYTPGSFYWMALLLKIFGSSILVGRAALLVYGGLFSALTYLLARRVCPRWWALFVTYLVTLICLPYRFMVLHNWDSTLLAYLALYCAVRLLETEKSKIENRQPVPAKAGSKIGNVWAFATGSFASLTFLFEHSKGAGLWLGLLAGYGVIVWRRGGVVALRESKIERPVLIPQRREKDREPRIAPSVYRLPSTVYCLLGAAWPFVVTLSYFAAKHGLVEMLTDWVWPLWHYSGANRLPYGYLVMSTLDPGRMFSGPWVERLAIALALGPCILLPILPLVALGIFLWSVVKPQVQQGESEVQSAKSEAGGTSGIGHRTSDHYFVLVSAVLCGLLFSTFLTKRPDFTHLNYLAPLFYLVLAWVLDGLNPPSRLWAAVKPVVAFVAFLSFTAFGMAMLWGPLGARHELRTARGTIRTPAPDLALEFLQGHVAPGEMVFVYPYQPLYYYLTATFSATPFDFLQPGMHTAGQLQESVAALQVSRPRMVLLEPSFSEKFALAWPNTPLEAVAAKDPVADYILAHYRGCRALNATGFWQFVFMVRKGENCE